MAESMLASPRPDFLPEGESPWVGGGDRSDTILADVAVTQATATPSSLPQQVASAVALSRQSTEGVLAVPPSPEQIDACAKVVIPQIKALGKNRFSINVLIQHVNDWLDHEDLPKSMSTSIVTVLRRKLSETNDITFMEPSRRSLAVESGNTHHRCRSLIPSIEECVDQSGLPPADQVHAKNILLKVLEALKDEDGKVLYAGLCIMMGRVCMRNPARSRTLLRGDLMQDALVHIVEYLCAKGDISLEDVGHATREPVTALKITLPDQSDAIGRQCGADSNDEYLVAFMDDETDGNLHSDGFLVGDSEDDSDGYDNEDFVGIDPSQPTRAEPGSEEKVRMLAARYAVGIPLFHHDDCLDHGPRRDNKVAPEDQFKITTPERHEAEKQASIAARREKTKKLQASILAAVCQDGRPLSERLQNLSKLVEDDDADEDDEQVIPGDIELVQIP